MSRGVILVCSSTVASLLGRPSGGSERLQHHASYAHVLPPGFSIGNWLILNAFNYPYARPLRVLFRTRSTQRLNADELDV
jgi:hypothetical protein